MTDIDLSYWRPKIAQAVGLQAKQHARWREAHRIVRGDWLSEYAAIIDPDYTPVNYAKAYVTSVVSSIYARDPYFFCNARHQARYGDFAHSMETVLNYFKERLNLKAQIKRLIVDALIQGVGWIEVGYTALFGRLNLTAQDDAGLFQRLLKGSSGSAEQGVLNEYVKEISPYAARISTWNVFLEPGYHSVHEMPVLYVAQDIAPEDLQSHPLYREAFGGSRVYPTRRIEPVAQAVSTPGLAIEGMRGGGATQARTNMYRLWHVWNRRDRQRFVWLDGSQDTAGPYPWNLAIEGFPQVELVFNDLPETDRSAFGYPISDLDFLMPQLREINRLRTQMVRRRKRSSGTIVAQETAITSEQATKLQNGDDLNLVLMKGNPSTDLHTFTPAPLAEDVYRIGERILADLDLIGQLGFLLPTIAPGDRRSATEVSYRAQGAGTTRSEKVDVIEEVMKEIGKRLAAVIWEYAPRALIQDILGEDQLPEALWPPLPDDADARRELIEQELQFSIEAGSTQPIKDRTLKNEQKIKFLNVIGGMFPERLKVTGAGLGRLADDMEMPDVKDWLILDDEQEQRAIEQENHLLAQNVPQIVGPNDQHQLHEQGHAAATTQGVQTVAMDQHLLTHRKFRASRQSKNPSQAGDQGATRGVASNPEVQRTGVPELADILGRISQMAKEPGSERGGRMNV